MVSESLEQFGLEKEQDDTEEQSVAREYNDVT
jgi:hypothetical protein